MSYKDLVPILDIIRKYNNDLDELPAYFNEDEFIEELLRRHIRRQIREALFERDDHNYVEFYVYNIHNGDAMDNKQNIFSFYELLKYKEDKVIDRDELKSIAKNLHDKICLMDDVLHEEYVAYYINSNNAICMIVRFE